VSKVSKNWIVKNRWLVGLALLLVSTLTFVQAQKGLEEQLAGVRLGAQFIDYDEEGRLKPDCLLAIYGMPDYIVGRGAAPAPTYLAGGSAAPAQNLPAMLDPLLKELKEGLDLMIRSERWIQEPRDPLLKELKEELDLMIRLQWWAQEPRIRANVKAAEIAAYDLGRINAVIRAYMRGEISREQAVKLIREIRKESEEKIEIIKTLGEVEEFWRKWKAGEILLSQSLARLQSSASGAMPGVGSEGTAGTTVVAPTFPHPEELAWVIPPFVQLDTNEFYFVYRRQGAHLNFLMKLTGTEGRKEFRVVAITVAGRRYDGARTAKGDPFKSIKLGDDLQRVLLRYGQPDEIFYYNPLTLQVVNTPTRHLILRYHRSSNIEFTTLENKVVRIFIFLPRQVTFIR
jgi:hypothetical protein